MICPMDKILIRFVLIPVLLALIAILVVQIRRAKKENEQEKMIDAETGIGNLRFLLQMTAIHSMI